MQEAETRPGGTDDMKTTVELSTCIGVRVPYSTATGFPRHDDSARPKTVNFDLRPESCHFSVPLSC